MDGIIRKLKYIAMSRLTKQYILRSGTLVSRKHNKSITIQYANRAEFNRMMKKVKYQSYWTYWPTGVPNRMNFDTHPRKDWS